ncbi:CobW/HypB/UreG family nucleotide-binding protein [Saliterribacillus persicus]|uniref:CobW/HypB/UreG family nucleotide-binding protein n=1 Tax=Saliterribacillus persicus TaxID=930114 RepID=A0A368Y5F3_9BACI|nr:CobW/HypB/UreG family nucleotide-binding protein [Saliterribacillus persicus]
MDEELGIDLSTACQLDTMVTVVDANRFGSGDTLLERKEAVSEEDERKIADLLLDQIEFCDVLILNKTDLVTDTELVKLTKVLEKLQPEAKIIKSSFGKVDPSEILGTGAFDFDKASESAGWLKELTIGHANHTPETEEYGVHSFVYVRKEPFHSVRFKSFVESMPKSIIRAKGIAWCATRNDLALLMSQAGPSTSIEPVSFWVAALPKERQQEIIREEPEVLDEWDQEYGDRMTNLVFIGIDMDQDLITEELDRCLLTESEHVDWDILEDPFDWVLQTN